MKTLKCSYEQEWNMMPIIELAINQLWASVPIAPEFKGKEFYEPIKEDITQNGLHFPLLVVRAKFWQLIDVWARNKDEMNPLPVGYNNNDPILVVWGGSNRLAIARELGYDNIDCVVFENGDFQKAWASQTLHRNPYDHFYGARV